jgi:hypothetical protein
MSSYADPEKALASQGNDQETESFGGAFLSPPAFQLFAGAGFPPSEGAVNGGNPGADGMVCQLKSDCKTLNERAEEDAQNGSMELREALGASMSAALPFEFNHSFNGGSKITVKQGGKITARVSANYLNKQDQVGTFLLSLIEAESGNAVKKYRVKVDGVRAIATFENLKAGTYFFQLQNEGDSDPEIKGNIWPTVTEGPGYTGDQSQENDQLESRLGHDTKKMKAEGRLTGQYVLRSEPTGQSYIFGNLPGNPVVVDLVDKRALAKDGSQDWYLVRFRDKEKFQEYAPCAPEPEFPQALQMYNSRTAWVTGDAVKGFISLGDFLQFVHAFEKEEYVQNMDLKARITHLRQMYSETELESDRILGTKPGRRSVDDRPSISGLYQMLKKSMTGVVLPNGEAVDAGHIILTLDAYNQPDREAEVHWSNQDAGSSRAAASWSGDVGAAVGDYLLQHQQDNLQEVDWDLAEWHFEKSAPYDDLMGNIDGVGMQQLSSKKEGGYDSIFQLIMAYYGVEKEGEAQIIKDHRKLGLSTVLKSYGFKEPTNLLTQAGPYSKMYLDARKLGEIWFRKGQPKLGLIADKVTPWVPGSYPVWVFNEQNLNAVTDMMMRKFIVRLEKYALQIGLKSFD